MSARAPREALQRREHRDEPAEQQAEAVAHDDQIGVVGDERAGGAEVEERPGRGRLVAEGVHVRHDVVAEPPLVRARPRRGRRRRGGPASAASASSGIGEAELALGLRQREPEPAPEPDAVRLAPEPLHRGRGVARAERRAPAIVAHRNTRSVKVICPPARGRPGRPRPGGRSSRSATCVAPRTARPVDARG